jgi:diguanylate cyclase (GGDEF)-like protein
MPHGLSIRTVTRLVMAGAIAATAVLAYVVYDARQARMAADDRLAEESARMVLYQDARAAALTETTNLAGFVILGDRAALPVIEQAGRDVESALTELRRTWTADDPAEDQAIADLQAAHEQLTRGYDQVIQLVIERDMPAVLALGVEGGLAPEATAFLEQIGARVDVARRNVLAAQRDAQFAESSSDRSILGIVVCWALLIVACGLLALRRVVQPIDQVARVTREIALGNTVARAPETGPVEVAHLGRDVNRMAETLIARSEELQQANAQLAGMLEAERERARRDGLTGTLNHGAIADELRTLVRSTASTAPTTVAMVDVNAMKAINDTYGHQTGDEVLRAVARALDRHGAVVGRYGGDEFVAILPGAGNAERERYREAVLKAVDEAELRDEATGSSVRVEVTIGLATFPAEAARVEELINIADGAMYAAKRSRPRDLPQQRFALDEDRAARMIGELTPLLASAGTLDEKLGVLAERLRTGTGYHGVSFEVFEEGADEVRDRNTTLGINAHVDGPEEAVDQWRVDTRSQVNHPMTEIMRETLRPIMLDDLSTDQRITDAQREILAKVGIRSGIAVPLLWQEEWIGTMSVGSRELAAFGPRDAQFLVAVAAHASAIVRTARMFEELRIAADTLASSRNDTVMLLAASVEAHDETTGGHLHRVCTLTEALAREMGMDDEEARRLGVASVLHDIGKVRVPDVILRGEARLTEEEWIVMKQHTTWGAEFLAGHSGLELAVEVAQCHHERWDGSGYPHGLEGAAIPESAAIVSVADALDAITSDRPYRRRRSMRAAVREIFACSGSQFSPQVVAALLRLYRTRRLQEVLDGAAGREPAELIPAA